MQAVLPYRITPARNSGVYRRPGVFYCKAPQPVTLECRPCDCLTAVKQTPCVRLG
jgi:hypothetical protein